MAVIKHNEKAGKLFYVHKVSAASYTTTNLDILQIFNVPPGRYKVTVGCTEARAPASTYCYFEVRVNGVIADLTVPGNWVMGFYDRAGLTGENNVAMGPIVATTILDSFTLPSNSFNLRMMVFGGTIVSPWYILEQLPPELDVGTAWD